MAMAKLYQIGCEQVFSLLANDCSGSMRIDVRVACEYAAVIPKPNETLEQENARLKKELAKARMERDLLKKATAYFASLEK